MRSVQAAAELLLGAAVLRVLRQPTAHGHVDMAPLQCQIVHIRAVLGYRLTLCVHVVAISGMPSWLEWQRSPAAEHGLAPAPAPQQPPPSALPGPYEHAKRKSMVCWSFIATTKKH